MLTPLRDLRRSSTVAKGVAVCTFAVLVAGIVTAAMRATPGGASSATAQAPSGTPAGWVRVVDRQVGFTAYLPDQPANDTVRIPLEGELARASHGIVIERFAASVASAAELARIFRGAIDALANGTGFQVVSERASIFRGHLAREGEYVADDGTRYRAVIFADRAGEVFLIGSSARYFEVVTAGFGVLAH
jgi:hypothetical protein